MNPDPYLEQREMEALRPSKMPWLLVPLLILAAGGLGYAAWKSLVQADAAQAARDEALHRLDLADKARGDLEQKMNLLEKDKTELTTRTQELQVNLQQTEAELSKLKATYDSLQDKM